MLQIALRAGVVHGHLGFAFIVLRHLWYEPRPTLKLLLPGDPRIPAPEPAFVLPQKRRRGLTAAARRAKLRP